MVLHHCRLRVRARAGARYVRGRQGEWRQGARRGSCAAEHLRLLLVPAAGAIVESEGDRPWTKRWQKEMGNKVPTMVQAGVYSGVLHYLKAVSALKQSKDGKAVVDKMKELPTDDTLFGKGSIRVDGRKIHPAYLFEVKKPSESKSAFDIYKLRATIPADEAFRPLKDGGCPLVKS